jgi:macrolide transport system ATP-binding/permease protein
MRWLAIVRNTLQSLFRRRQAEVELEDEFQYHLEREIESNMRAGMPPKEARLAALRLIGPLSFHQEACRDWRGTAFLETCVRDARYALHMLRRTPLFTAAAILTLALGIGANTTVFTFVDNILLRPVPVRDPQQLAFLNWGQAVSVSYPNYVDFRDRNRVFSNLIAYRYMPASMSIQARENYRVWGNEASGNYFEALGVKPFLGRFFGPAEDDKPDGHPVLVISHRLWRNRFAADPNIIGRQVRINAYPFTVIGVAPPGFGGTELIVSADYWAPLSMEPRIEPGNDWPHSRYASNIWAMGRLRPGVSRAQAEADLNRIARQLADTYPDVLDRKSRFHLSPPGLIGEALRGPITGFGVVLMGIGGLVLLLACVNLAGMLTARASDRRREIGIRLALGASKARLLRQLMTESLLLAAMGGLAGFAIAFGACKLFSSWRVNIDLPLETSLQPDALVLGFTAAAALATTLFFGLMPALQAIRTDLIPSLKNAPANRFRRWGARDLIVTGQIALSVILVICSVLAVRSLQHALALNLGFEPAGAVSASFDLWLQGYDRGHSRTFDAALIAKASALPGIQAAGIINNFPLRIGEDNSVVSRVDRPIPPPSERHGAIIYKISPGYLRAAGTKLVLGRDLDSHDREGAPAVAIVNQAFTDLLFAKENPVGKYFRITIRPSDPGIEIVGVAETGKYESLGEDPKPVVFLPIEQTGTEGMTLVARTSLPPQQAVEMLRKTVLDLDPELTLYSVGGLKDQLALPLFPARAAAIVLGIFGFLAMVLAATGLFALMAYAVARRTREIGIRMALGARPGLVLSSVLQRTLVLCAVGVSLGALATLAAGRLLSAVLYGVSPRDPVTYATAILLMSLVALLACWSPATRAIRIDPARTLREE